MTIPRPTGACRCTNIDIVFFSFPKQNPMIPGRLLGCTTGFLRNPSIYYRANISLFRHWRSRNHLSMMSIIRGGTTSTRRHSNTLSFFAFTLPFSTIKMIDTHLVVIIHYSQSFSKKIKKKFALVFSQLMIIHGSV